MNNWTNINTKSLEKFGAWLSQMQSWAVLLPETPSLDAAFAASGLVLWLQSLGKQARIVCAGAFPFDLLEFGVRMKPSQTLDGSHLVALLDIRQSGLGGITYTVLEDSAEIVLEAVKGNFTPEDLVVEMRPVAYDAAIILEALYPEQLGNLFFENTEVFEIIPKFGIYKEIIPNFFTQLYISKPTAVALSEMVSEIVSFVSPSSLSETAATLLYTGLSAATRNFQSENVTGTSLSCAAQLLERGANQQQAALYLYPKQPLESLKFFGRALEALRLYPDIPAAIAIFEEDFGLSVEDFGRTLWDLQGWLGGNYPVLLGSLDSSGHLLIVVSLHDFMDTSVLALFLDLKAPKFSAVGALNIFSAVSNLTPSEAKMNAEVALRSAIGML